MSHRPGVPIGTTPSYPRLQAGVKWCDERHDYDQDREPDQPHGTPRSGRLPGSLAEGHDAHQQSAYAGRFQRDEEQAADAVSHGWRARPLTVLVQLLALPREFTAVTATK